MSRRDDEKRVLVLEEMMGNPGFWRRQDVGLRTAEHTALMRRLDEPDRRPWPVRFASRLWWNLGQWTIKGMLIAFAVGALIVVPVGALVGYMLAQR